MATTPTISQLQDLDDLADDVFSNTFTCNLTTIFQYARNDIISSLEQRDLATLAALRSSLCDLTQQNLDAYVDAVPVQRKVKHTTANDIFALGFCLVNKQRTKDSDKVFNIKHEASPEVDIDPEVTELGELVLVVIRLQQTVNNLESQVTELQTANSELQTRLDEHIASTPTEADHPEGITQDQDVPSQLTAPPVDVAQPSQSTQLGDAQQQQHSSRRNRRYSFESDSSSLSSDSDTSDSEGFTVIRPRKRTKHKTRKIRAERPPGQLASSGTSDIYVGGIDQSNTCSDLRAHLAKHGISVQGGDIHELTARGNRKSFRISIPADQEERVTSAGRRMWPNRVICRRFHHRRPAGGLAPRQHHRNIRAANTVQHRRGSGPRPQHRRRPYSQDTQHGPPRYRETQRSWWEPRVLTDDEWPAAHSSRDQGPRVAWPGGQRRQWDQGPTWGQQSGSYRERTQWGRPTSSSQHYNRH